MQSIKIIIGVIFILGTVTASFANWGGSNFGGDNFGADKWGSGGVVTATYWSTAMTDRWTDPMTALWSTTMNTEIP